MGENMILIHVNHCVAVLILLFLLISRRRKDKMLLEVDAADDIRENVVFYDEEGAGKLYHSSGTRANAFYFHVDLKKACTTTYMKSALKICAPSN